MAEASIEVTTRYATSVDDLPAAWAFVMEHLDMLGPDPTVTIKPVWLPSLIDDRDDGRIFEVVVEGMVVEPREGVDRG